MNWEHLKAFVWLRFRIQRNQVRRAGTLNLVFYIVVLACSAVASVGMLFAAFFVGWLALPHAPEYVRLFVWDGVVAVLAFMWMIGLLAELQRSESLAIDKVLHLPVSASGAFVVNYVSSLASLTLLVTVPALVGLAVGQAVAHGPAMLLALPLVAAFVLALTAVTYQFQGWLASLMSNPRRRRTVVVLVTMSFILVAQAPNLINIAKPWKVAERSFHRDLDELKALNEKYAGKKVVPGDYQKDHEALQQMQKERRETEKREGEAKLLETSRTVNAVVPLGWLPLGAHDLAAGRVWPTLLGLLGYLGIASLSLWRAYRTTVRLYTGHYSGAARTPATTGPVARSEKPTLVEKTVPWVSEHASAVAVAMFRSLSRAPEAKMAMIAPAIMLLVLGGLVITTEATPPAVVRPLMAFAGGVMVFLSGVQLTGNQFGYDRSGFRAFVLSPVPRREILLGKNLAVAPMALVPSLLVLAIVGGLFPMRVDHYPAVLLQSTSSFLLFCVLANGLSILAPMPVAAGAMKPANHKFLPVLLQMMFFVLFPIIFIPILLPYGIEVLLAETGVLEGWPVSLALSIPVLLLCVWIYRRLLTVEGNWLSAREQTILEVVTKVEG